MSTAARLLAVHDAMEPEERRRLARELAEGDPLARVVGKLIADARQREPNGEPVRAPRSPSENRMAE